MQEILMGGPVEVSWNPPYGYSAYKSGIMIETVAARELSDEE